MAAICRAAAIGLEVHAHLACKLDQHERARARLYLNSAMAAAVALPDDPASSDRRRGKAADVTSICTDCSCVRWDHTGARSGTDVGPTNVVARPVGFGMLSSSLCTCPAAYVSPMGAVGHGLSSSRSSDQIQSGRRVVIRGLSSRAWLPHKQR